MKNPKGFKDDSNGTTTSDTTDDYKYDNYGNMTQDENKNITLIKYNHLNLPVEVTFTNNRTINYTYTANGEKLIKQVNNGGNITTTDYLNGFQYQTTNANLTGSNPKLQFFPTTEGYVRALYIDNCTTTDQIEYQYVYNYTDHLGNIRLTYTADTYGNPKKLEENNYYPFGLRHGKYNQDKKKLALKEEANKIEVKRIPTATGSNYKYKYNGKELQDEFGLNWYDYGARNYDLNNRWMNIDPLSEEYYSWSPYVYAKNNPVRFIDPDGRSVDDLILKGKNAKKVIQTMNLGLGGEYVSMDSKGKVSINITESQIKNLTDEQKGLYEIINQTMDPNTLTKIIVKNGDHTIVSGDYNSGKIDIGDINAFGTSDSVMTKYSVLGHEINEQFEYQQGNKKDYNVEGSSHTNSNKKEKTMNGGWERGKGTTIENAPPTKNKVIINRVERNPVYGINVTYKIPYTKNGVIRFSIFKVINGNVVPRK